MAKGRPKMAQEDKRVAITITVTKEVKAAAEATRNASRFFEKAALKWLRDQGKEGTGGGS